MQVILTQDVDMLGLAGQVLNVAPGYARNKLIPARLAVEATPGNLKAFEKAREEFKVRSLKEKDQARLMAKRIEAITLTIPKKAGEQDKLYGSVTTMELVEALAEQDISVDRRKIKLAEPIKTLGEHAVSVKLHPEVSAVFMVNVIQAQEE